MERNTYVPILENNIVTADEYFDRAKTTLNTISDTLSKSLGYYGSTTILEDNINGNTVTKDGYTILRSIRFGSDDTLSNTLLKSIIDISQSLVHEVGDGSTSAVVTSEAVFRYLTDSNTMREFLNEEDIKILTKYPKRVILDELKKITLEITKLIKEEYSIPINVDNFEILKNIASVSNNNDDDTGDLLYEIYSKIGKDGFIFMENRLGADKDTYEISNGIESSSGMIDSIYSNKSNGIESEYIKPKILLIQGQLTQSDISWLTDFVGTHYMNHGVPLVIVASNYDKEVLDFFKINKINNDRNPSTTYEMGITLFNANYKEELKDLAAYLGSKVLNVEEDTLDEIIKPFINNNHVEKMMVMEEYLGSAKKVYMNNNYTRFIEGLGSEEDIAGRVDLINKHISYYSSQSHITEDHRFNIHKLEKRKGNLTSKIAKLYVAGKSFTEIESRKFLLEDAISASRSALNHGYVSGGNLLVSKIALKLLNENNKEDNSVYKILLSIIHESFKTTFKKVLENANIDSASINDILYNCIDRSEIFNLRTHEYEKDNETNIVNSSMTDIKILESVVSIIGLMVTSNQYIQKMPRPLR